MCREAPTPTERPQLTSAVRPNLLHQHRFITTRALWFFPSLSKEYWHWGLSMITNTFNAGYSQTPKHIPKKPLWDTDVQSPEERARPHFQDLKRAERWGGWPPRCSSQYLPTQIAFSWAQTSGSLQGAVRGWGTALRTAWKQSTDRAFRRCNWPLADQNTSCSIRSPASLKALRFPPYTMKKNNPPPCGSYLVELLEVVFNRSAALNGCHRLVKFVPGVLRVVIGQLGPFCGGTRRRLRAARGARLPAAIFLRSAQGRSPAQPRGRSRPHARRQSPRAARPGASSFLRRGHPDPAAPRATPASGRGRGGRLPASR